MSRFRFRLACRDQRSAALRSGPKAIGATASQESVNMIDTTATELGSPPKTTRKRGKASGGGQSIGRQR
eukprot:492660-Amphidinium_carterae.1